MNYAWRPVRPLNNSAASFVAIVNNKCLLREIDGVRTTAADIRNSGPLDETPADGIRVRARTYISSAFDEACRIDTEKVRMGSICAWVRAYVCVCERERDKRVLIVADYVEAGEVRVRETQFRGYSSWEPEGRQ